MSWEDLHPNDPNYPSRAMNDIAVIFYSRSGTTRLAAQMLADRLDCPLFEVEDAVSRAGFRGDLRCVIDNLLRRHVPYRYAGPPLSEYANLVFMAPVWVGHLAAPMRSFLRDQRPFTPGVAAAAVMAARGGFRAAEEIAEALGRPPHPVIVLLQRDVVSGDARADIDAFATALISQPTTDPGVSRRPAWLSPNEA